LRVSERIELKNIEKMETVNSTDYLDTISVASDSDVLPTVKCLIFWGLLLLYVFVLRKIVSTWGLDQPYLYIPNYEENYPSHIYEYDAYLKSRRNQDLLRNREDNDELLHALPNKINKKTFSQPIGLHNPSFYCYQNVIVQTFLTIPEVGNLMQNLPHLAQISNAKDGTKSFSETLALGLWYIYCNQQTEQADLNIYMNPLTLRRSIKSLSEGKYSGSFQIDAVEFLDFFIHKVIEEFENIFASNAEIDNLFFGSIAYKVPSGSIHTNKFLTLPVNIMDGVSSLEEAFQSTYGDNQGEVVQKIESLPPVLIIQLFRFTYNREEQKIVKLTKKIHFPQRLTIPHFAMSENLQEHCTEDHKTYNLTSVIYHKGLVANMGHYNCDIFHDTLNTWVHYDDECVSRIGCPTELNNPDRFTPYILFYRRAQPEVVTPLVGEVSSEVIRANFSEDASKNESIQHRSALQEEVQRPQKKRKRRMS